VNRLEIQNWCDESGILTVGKLRELLTTMDDLTQVIVYGGLTYKNVNEVILADDENPAVTLVLGSVVSPIQF
tara:strand:+ start:194 stop:409 length:216 start_codon:yes stop_codon:yes gene_type:complete